MGLFDRLKKKETLVPKQEEEEKKNYLESNSTFFGRLPDGTKYTLFGFEEKLRFTHRDKRVTAAIIAQILNTGIDDRFIEDNSSYISFEIEPDKPVTREMCQRLIESYLLAKGQNGKYHTYLGELTETPTGEISHKPGSATVVKYMDDIAQALLQQREMRKRKSNEKFYQERRADDENRKQRALKEHENAEDLEQKVLQERLKHPYFTKIRKDSDREEYNGVDLETGEIMRLREVHKLLKDDGTYLYTAYRIDVKDDDAAEMTPEEYGYPIAFETDFRLEDIPELPDKDVMMQMLTFLGIDKKNLSKAALTYIGKLDREGTIERNRKSRSKFMNEKIEALKAEFKRRLDERFDGR